MKMRTLGCIGLLTMLVACSQSDDTAAPGIDMIAFAGIEEVRGLRTSEPDLAAGYVLFSPLISDTSYLIDREGRVVNQWHSEYAPSGTYLLADGHLVRGARAPDAPRFNGGGQGGRIEKFNWDGELVWSFELATDARLLHHDFAVMPNGNILALAWESKTHEQALAAGRQPDKTPVAGVWPDLVIEIEPTTASGGTIVWEWHSWDHMVQNQDPGLPNFGDPADYPRKIDINAGPPLPETTAEELAQNKAIGRAPTSATLEDRGSDMHHSNAISYNPELDQIAISVRELSEVWIIDHGINTVQSAGPAGDLLYRWGNPSSYGHPENDAVGLGHQHDIRWIPAGYPGAGNLTAFSNDAVGSAPPYSEIVEFTPPMNASGSYLLEPGQAFGPQATVWEFSIEGFYSPFISGAHRLANGNTFISFGPQGRFVEVNPAGETVWEFWSPYSGDVRLPDGSLPQPVAPFMFATFRATFIPADDPALAGRDLAPLVPQPVAAELNEEDIAPFR